MLAPNMTGMPSLTVIFPKAAKTTTIEEVVELLLYEYGHQNTRRQALQIVLDFLKKRSKAGPESTFMPVEINDNPTRNIYKAKSTMIKAGPSSSSLMFWTGLRPQLSRAIVDMFKEWSVVHFCCGINFAHHAD